MTGERLVKGKWAEIGNKWDVNSDMWVAYCGKWTAEVIMRCQTMPVGDMWVAADGMWTAEVVMRCQTMPVGGKCVTTDGK